MASNSIHTAVSAEQMMLSKMEAMQFVVQPELIVSANPLDTQNITSSLSFSDAMTNVFDAVNQYQSAASKKMTAVETGQSDDLVGAMIASQKASLSFDALMQVRNKVVTSFEDIMKMPI